jgi:hypothetical protein
MWLALLDHDGAPTPVRLVRTFHLQDIVDIRRYNYSQPCLAAGNTNHGNPLASYPSRYSEFSFDSVEGLSSGLALLRIGVSVQQHLPENGALPRSLDDLIPEYMDQLPENPSGMAFVSKAGHGLFEISSPGIENKVSERTLRFDKEELKSGSPVQ